MKKFLALFVSVFMIFGVVGCGGGDSAPASGGDEKTSEAPAGISYQITDTRVKTWTDFLESQWVQTIVEIYNDGEENIYFTSGEYDLKDSAGNIVYTTEFASTYPEILAPGEYGYMYEETIIDNPVEGELTVDARPMAYEPKVDLVRLEVTDTECVEDEFYGYKFIGNVTNNTDTDYSMNYVVAELYDGEDNFVGLATTLVSEDIPAGGSAPFEISTISLPDDVKEDFETYLVYCYPSQFNF